MAKTSKSKIPWKKLTRRLKSPFKIRSDKSVSLHKKDVILQKKVEEKMTSTVDWTKVLDTLRNKDDEPFDFNSINLALTGMDREMGFGFVSDETQEARVVLQGPNPFLDNFYGKINPQLGEYIPYSQIYDVKNKSTDGNSFLFLRHYLQVQGLSDKEVQSIKVAASDGGSFNGIFSENIIWDEAKSPVQSIKVEKKSTLRKQNSKLLDQMVSVIGSHQGSGVKVIEESSGYIVITIHKALDIEKKGMVGKADPYVVLQYHNQKTLKSRTVDNNQNPVWHFTGHFKLCEDNEENILIRVYDDDIGKDDFLGEYSLNPKEIRKVKEMTNKTVNLEKCKSGQLVISCKFIPLQDLNKKIGQLSLIIHGAQKLEKKNKLKKADPYLVCTLGDVVSKSPTINGTSNPKWEFKSEFDVFAVSPRQLSVEVYDDDIGKDSPIGNVTLDLQAIMSQNELERTEKLENCKSGSIIFSAFFEKSFEVDNGPKVEVTTTTITTMSTSNSKDSPNIFLLDPVFIDEDFIVIQKTDNKSWFMVVSPEKTLPIKMNIVPFKKYSREDSALHFKCLPASGFHQLKAVVHSGKGLRKSGYERPCVLNRDQRYQFLAQNNKETVNLGNFVPTTWGPDTTELRLANIDPGQELVNIIIQGENKDVVTEGTISLYSGIEAA